METDSSSILIPRNFLPITTSAVAALPLLDAVLEIVYHASLVMDTVQLDAVQVEVVPVYVNVPYSVAFHNSAPLLSVHV